MHPPIPIRGCCCRLVFQQIRGKYVLAWPIYQQPRSVARRPNCPVFRCRLRLRDLREENKMLATATIQEDKKKLGTLNRPKYYRCLVGAGFAAGLSALLATGTVSYAAAADGSPVTGGTVVAGIDPGQLSTFNTQLTSVTSSLVVADVWADGLMT